MKINRSYLFITASSLALLAVLIIQVNWILQTAKMKEDIFNEKATLVLSKTAEALSADQQACGNIARGGDEKQKLDSLFNHFMNQYNIHVDYNFEVKPVTEKNQIDFSDDFLGMQRGNYMTCVDGVSTGSGLNLKLIFPTKSQYILAEMGIPFILSVILLLVVIILSWRTILSLMKEKKISEHTTDFLNNMTHEFKTPLTNIALAGKMMAKDSNIHEEEKIKHYSEIILQENEKLKLQVEEVLSMTALERGEIPLQKTELDVHQLIHESLKCISVQIESSNGEVKLKLNATQHNIIGDKAHLTNALCNLIDNGIKYSKGKPVLSIQTFNSAQNIIILIADNGIGIEKKYRKKVFEKFFRVPTGNVHDVKGFGLGLAYTKKIFELHGGTIELESEKEKGTTFTITLPNA